MLTENDIAVFIDGTKHYFKTSTDEAVVVETPYLVSTEDLVISDFTGVIGISGDRKGIVFVTAQQAMLRYLVLSLGEKTADPELIRDVIGEVANTISGNARRQYGPGFMISVPLIVQGKPVRMGLPRDRDMDGYVIPFRWKSFPFQLVVSLK
ncbi:MAG: chemotaxis protein CheX [Pseudomonadota bacterium]